MTALAEEREAVRRHLRDVRVVRSGTTTGDIGVFESDGNEATVAIIETGPGNVHASTATSSALRDLDPKTVAMVGIAGGVKDVSIGDVVASRKVYWVEPEKLEAEQTVRGTVRSAPLPRPDFGPVSNRLVQTARGVVADDMWRRRGLGGDARRLNGEPARALVSPLAIVEKVVADGQSTLAIAIRQSFSDASLWLMEDFGVLRAVDQHERLLRLPFAGSPICSTRRPVPTNKAGKNWRRPMPQPSRSNCWRLISDCRQNRPSTGAKSTELTEIAATLYPAGPSDRSIWQRAGGESFQGSARGGRPGTLVERP